VSIVIDIAAQFTGKKAFAQAENAADKLGRSVKHALIGVGVTAFAKSAISAFAAQEKQLALFSNSLRSIGFEFATSDSLAFLNTLKLQYGVTDTQLIPAYEQLLTTTRSLAASQYLTNVAMDIAARQNISVTSAADALSKAYLGNTKSVGALGLGISKATLASGDFGALLKEITTITKGAASAAADTFSNKLARLKVAADAAKVSIGAGLVEALMQISNSTSIDQLQTKIINFGESAAVTLSNIGRLISDNIVLIKSFAIILAAAFTVNKIASFIIALQGIVKVVTQLRNALLASAIARNFLFSPLGAAVMTAGMFAAIGLAIKGVDALSDSATKAKNNMSNLFKDGSDRGNVARGADIAAAKAAKIAKDLAAAQLKATKAQTKLLQDQAKLKKANTLFDIDQVQLFAALQGKVTAEEKLRLSLQLALLQGNASEAERLGKQLAISQLQTTNLAQAIANIPMALNPFKGWGTEIDNLLAKMIEMYRLLNSPIIMNPSSPSAIKNESYYRKIASDLTVKNLASGIPMGTATGLAASSARLEAQSDAYFAANPNIDPRTGVVYNINVNGATQGLLDQLRNDLINSSASGSFSSINSPAG
jgi:hypothetical protein